MRCGFRWTQGSCTSNITSSRGSRPDDRRYTHREYLESIPITIQYVVLLSEFSHSSLVALYRDVDIIRREIWPIAIREKIFRIRTLKEKISRMSHMSASTDNQIWRWESSSIEMCEDILTSDILHIFT